MNRGIKLPEKHKVRHSPVLIDMRMARRNLELTDSHRARHNPAH
jgi:hypothetical protein